MLPLCIVAMPPGEERTYMEQLYSAHHRVMFYTARQYSDDYSVIEEAVSNSCLALMKKQALLRDMNEARVVAYIVAVVKSKTMDALKAHQRESARRVQWDQAALGIAAPQTEAHRRLEAREALLQVNRAIDDLPERERAVMRMKFFEEMENEEIARRLGISENTVRGYIKRARDKIKEKVVW